MPRPAKTSRDQILQVALALVDEGGLETLSMRRLAGALRLEAMSLYRHVPNKAALLDGIHEVILSEMQLPPTSGHWQTDARGLAMAFRVSLKRHPRAISLFATRPAITQASLVYVEQALVTLAPQFPDLQRRVQAFQTLVAFVVGHALSELAPASPGPDYTALPKDRFPILSQLGPALERYSIDDEFELGLSALLTGLALQASTMGPA